MCKIEEHVDVVVDVLVAVLLVCAKHIAHHVPATTPTPATAHFLPMDLNFWVFSKIIKNDLGFISMN